MFRKPIKLSDIPNKLPDSFNRLRDNEAMIWMENHRLKYMIGGSANIYEATGITILDSANKKIPVTADKVFKITGNYIKKTTVTETSSDVRLDIELSLEGDAILDIMPLATDTNYGITILDNSLLSTDFLKATSAWSSYFNREYVKQHTDVKNIYTSKPTSPLYGDAYYDSTLDKSYVFGKFIQYARIFGTYIKGERIIAVLYADDEFISRVNSLPITINDSETVYKLNQSNPADIEQFMTAHNIPIGYRDVLTFFTIQSGTGLVENVNNAIIFISCWDEIVGNLKPQVEQNYKIDEHETAIAEHQTKLIEQETKITKQQTTITTQQSTINEQQSKIDELQAHIQKSVWQTL